jgi:hypothetical protein
MSLPLFSVVWQLPEQPKWQHLKKSQQAPFFFDQQPRRLQRVFVFDFNYFVNQIEFEHVGYESGAYALNLVRPLRAAT